VPRNVSRKQETRNTHPRAYRTVVTIFKLLSHGKPSETAIATLYTSYILHTLIRSAWAWFRVGDYPSLHVGRGSIALVVIVPRWWWVSACGNVAEVGGRRDGPACSPTTTKDVLDEGWSATQLRAKKTQPPRRFASSTASSLAMTIGSILQRQPSPTRRLTLPHACVWW